MIRRMFKAFGVFLLVLLALWFWPETLRLYVRLRRRRNCRQLSRKRLRRDPAALCRPTSEATRRQRKAWESWFEQQKEASWQRLEQIRKDWDSLN